MFYLLNKLKHVTRTELIKRSLVPAVRLMTTNNGPRAPGGALASIKSFLSKRPLVSNCVTYGLLYTGSEWLQQTIMIMGAEAEEVEVRGYDTGSLLR